MGKYKDISKEIHDYAKTRDSHEITDGKASVIVKMPVEVGKRIFDVSDLSSLSDLPVLSERLRDFAFRYGTEYNTQEGWAETYGVDRKTIRRWLAKPEVAQVIALNKFEMRSISYGYQVSLRQKMYRKLSDFLDAPLKTTNMDSILAAIKFINSEVLGEGGGDISGREKGVFNVNIGMQSSRGEFASPHRIERDITPKELAKIEYDIERATAILEYTRAENGSGKADGNNGDS